MSTEDGIVFVYKTRSCPTNRSQWLWRSASIQCTSESGYMCIPDDNLIELVEFCHTFATSGILKGWGKANRKLKKISRKVYDLLNHYTIIVCIYVQHNPLSDLDLDRLIFL